MAIWMGLQTHIFKKQSLLNTRGELNMSRVLSVSYYTFNIASFVNKNILYTILNANSTSIKSHRMRKSYENNRLSSDVLVPADQIFVAISIPKRY